MAEKMVSGWRCKGRTEGVFGICCSNVSRPAVEYRCKFFVKGLGSQALPILDLRLEQQTRRGLMRRGRKGGMRVRSVAQPIREEAMVERRKSTEYTDSWLEVKAVEFLTDRISFLSGKTTDLTGYDGFVDITKKFVHGLPSTLQRERVIELLHIVLPQWFLFCFRIIPKTTPIKEFYAKFTLVFFKWLVGECEVREGEIDGVIMKSTVHIKKCRYLEQSQCVGLCVNLCKHPTQTFILEQFGMPLTMNPNFEDMSCEMIYGLHPPPLEEDPAYQQPCYPLCETGKERPNCT
ncbi:unnamed protein product [Calypogeia fissa]